MVYRVEQRKYNKPDEIKAKLFIDKCANSTNVA